MYNLVVYSIVLFCFVMTAHLTGDTSDFGRWMKFIGLFLGGWHWADLATNMVRKNKWLS